MRTSFNPAEINEQLQKLYESVDEELWKRVENVSLMNGSLKMTNPFLLKVPESYSSARRLVMVFGQETYGWCHKYSRKQGLVFMPNNVAKIGYVKKKGDKWVGTTGNHKTINKALDYIIKKEIEILRPDLLIFECGWSYAIPPCLGKYIAGYATEKPLCKIIFEDKNLPQAYRTYHPGYIQRHQDLKWVYEEINKVILSVFE